MPMRERFRSGNDGLQMSGLRTRRGGGPTATDQVRTTNTATDDRSLPQFADASDRHVMGAPKASEDMERSGVPQRRFMFGPGPGQDRFGRSLGPACLPSRHGKVASFFGTEAAEDAHLPSLFPADQVSC